MDNLQRVVAAAEGEAYEVATPAGRVVVLFPFDDQLPPKYAGDPVAIVRLHEAISACIGDTGASLSPGALTPLALTEIVPAADAGITVSAPFDSLDSEPPMPNTDSLARRVIQFPAHLLDSAAAAPAIADLRAAVSAAGASVMARLTAARELLASIASAGTEASNDDAPAAPRRLTAQLYDYDDNRKPAQRKRENAAAMALLAKIDAGELKPGDLTDADKATLARYSGKGGGLTDMAGKRGSAYEYYTPKPIAEGVWSLLGELGFTGGKVLDPSAGTGIFGATAPASAVVDAVELNETSGRINELVNGGPGYKAIISPFEKVAAATPDEAYDAIVTNVPFGDKVARGSNYKHDERYQDEPLQNYFILRSLEKLRPGGLAAFITPTSCVSGRDAKSADMRVRASYMAEFLGAYRLPNSVFDTAAADVTTDVIVFRKYSRDALEKIEELREQAPQTLVEANVQWQEFVSGKYFLGEGKRFILGEAQAGMGKWGEVERIVTTQPTGEVAKMLRRFPDSRVNWELIDATETQPITYADGDVLTQAGQTLEYRGGEWHPVARADDDAGATLPDESLTDPLAAYEARVTYAQMGEYLNGMARASRNLEVPSWIYAVNKQLDKLPAGDREKWWNVGLVGMSVGQVLEERMAMESGVNFLDEYPRLSESMRTLAKVAKTAPSSFRGALGQGIRAIGVHYRKGEFSEVWRGEVAEIAAITTDKGLAFEGLRYEARSVWVDAERAKEVFGDDFDPISSEEWCVSADGKRVARADDFYIGNVKDVLEQLDRDIAEAATPEIKAKLLWMKSHAASRYHVINVDDISYKWTSPFATIQEKLEFARRYVHDSAYIDTTASGEEQIKLDLPASARKSDAGKLKMRLSDYLARGVVSLGQAEIAMPESAAMAELRRMVATVNQQFDGFCRGNRAIRARLEQAANDPAKLRFRAADDERPLNIPGLHAWWAERMHGYQTSFVRKAAREFGGINGFDVGLGKTATALAAVQYTQAIGVKSKTGIVVPNSVLSNWRKEAVIGDPAKGIRPVYSSGEDCLFVGLRAKRGRKIVDLADADPADPTIEFIVDSKYYDEDLNRVLTNKHRKVFMSMEAFERIKLRTETAEGFMAYMAKHDAFFAETESDKDSDQQRAESKTQSLLDVLTEKVGAAPYLEDMGFDSLVLDEAHNYKNSVRAYDTPSAKFLSLPLPAKRGLDMQAKAWYIRGASPLRDGVLGLTATPITNSPLEIYSMLSLTAGHDRVNDMFAGIRGADHFLATMAQTESIEDEGVDGETRDFNMFVGLDNVEMLRKAIGDVMTIRDAEDVGKAVVLPEADTKDSPINMTPAIYSRLGQYVNTYKFIKYGPDKAGAQAKQDAEAVLKHFQIAPGDLQGIGVFANAFNLINNMEMLILDPELDERATFYSYRPADAGAMAKVVDEFNGKKLREKRSRKGPHTTDAAVLRVKETKDAGTGLIAFEYTIQCVATLRGAENRVLIDSMSPDAQDAFEKIAEKHGVELDVSASPKLAALIENVQLEMARPRGVDDEGKPSPIVKQIIFCDRLAIHNKIKRLLAKRCGVPAAKIAIVTGERNNEVDEILAVQDGFNAHGEANQYQIIIANKKAEVGINLQRGTQAIHHLSIGWTPDSLHQRNGRGVRQGNKTERVSVYYYDADGTFDSYRRKTVSKKAEWIGEVLDADGENFVNVNGGASDSLYQQMIEAQGDKEKLAQLEARAEEIEKMARIERNRANQLINAQNVIIAKRKLAEMATVESFIKERMAAAYGAWKRAQGARKQLQSDKVGAAQARRLQAKIEAAESELAGMQREIEDSIEPMRDHYGRERSLTSVFRDAEASRKSNSGVPKLEQEKNYVRSVRFTAKAESPLASERQHEVDMAESEVKQYTEAFIRQSKAEGALPAEAIEALNAGSGWMMGGRLVVTGAFLRGSDGSLVLFESEARALNALARGQIVAMSINGDDRFDRLVSSDTHTLILPGQPGYDDALTAAAEIEDAEVSNGGDGKALSAVVPAISLRRKVRSSARYEASRYRLPAPHFPFAIRYGGTPVRDLIVAEQKSVIRGFSGYPESFAVADDVAVVAGSWTHVDLSRALIDRARAEGLPVAEADIGYSAAVLQQLFSEAVGPDAYAALLQSGSTPDEVTNAVESAVREALPWFTFGSSIQPRSALDYTRASQLTQRLAALRAAASAPAASVAAPVAPSGGADPAMIVGIKGDTKKWFRIIKAAAASVGSGRYKWDGKAGVWNVYGATWNQLVAQYPQAKADLEMTEATITRF